MTDWIIWPIFLGAVIFLGFILEIRALGSWDPKRVTLSRFVWTVGEKFPLSIFWGGFIVGTLVTHFFWHWCPALGIGHG